MAAFLLSATLSRDASRVSIEDKHDLFDYYYYLLSSYLMLVTGAR